MLLSDRAGFHVVLELVEFFIFVSLQVMDSVSLVFVQCCRDVFQLDLVGVFLQVFLSVGYFCNCFRNCCATEFYYILGKFPGELEEFIIPLCEEFLIMVSDRWF